MKKIVFALLALFAISLLSAQTPGTSSIKWNNFDKGVAEAKKSGKKVLIDVYTDWCTWCKKMDQNTYSDKTIRAYLNKNFVLVKLNPEKDGAVTYEGKKYPAAEFSQGMGVNGYPATLFLRSDGQPITILPGYSEPAMFIHVLSFISEDHYKSKKFSDYLAEKGIKQ